MSKITIFSGQVAAAATAVYTATIDTTIDAASICNTTAGGLTVSVWLAPTGAASGNANKVYDALAVGANSTVQLSSLINQAIPRGGILYLLASAATSLTATISGRT
jgi:hypothetical protein